MDLPVVPPVAPMLARLAHELPDGPGFLFEPKWDGFRCLAFRAGDDVDLRSRNDRPLARYFPELVDAIRALPETHVVLDGEIVVIAAEEFDFAAVMARLHPAASRVAELARTTPASYVAFDALAVGRDRLLDRPFAERRAALEEVVTGAAGPGTVTISPVTDDVDVASAWLDVATGGSDGVMAKRIDGRYEPGRRAMVKVKHERTADCVVAGFRWFADPPGVASLLLALFDDTGALRHVGVASAFRRPVRGELLEILAPRVVPLEAHPWANGFGLEGGALGRLPGTAGRWTPEMERDWVPVDPVLVCEVVYDQMAGHRFRHPARFRRWRPDRDPSSCTYDQLRVSTEPST